MRVLVVDDNPQVVATVSAIARSAGHEVETLASSLGFTKAFVKFKPDVLILDVLMPNVDGFEILQWLIDVDFTGRIIAMSGDVRYTTMLKAMAEAKSRTVVRTMDKPFRAEDLLSALTK